MFVNIGMIFDGSRGSVAQDMGVALVTLHVARTNNANNNAQ